MTHDELVERVSRGMWEAVGADPRDFWDGDFHAYECQARAAIAVVLEEAEKICRDKQLKGKDAQSCADAIKKLKDDA